jgi:hypothetical protein
MGTKHDSQHSVFISNYNNPNGTDSEIPPKSITTAISSTLGVYPFSSVPRSENSGFHISVIPQHYQTVCDLHGRFIGGRRRIWIIKSPSAQLSQLWPHFRRIFSTISCGCARLCDLRTLIQNEGGNGSVVNFRNRDFVEFFLFALGRMSQDDGLTVEQLDISNNPIGNLNLWLPFLFFLPELRLIFCHNCAFTEAPHLPSYISVDAGEFAAQRTKGKGRARPDQAGVV